MRHQAGANRKLAKSGGNAQKAGMRLLTLFLVICGLSFSQTVPTPPERVEVWGTVIQVLEKGLLVQPKTNTNLFVLVGHPDQDILVDNAVVLVWAAPVGRVQFTDSTGRVRTLPKLKFLEKSNNVYQGR